MEAINTLSRAAWVDSTCQRVSPQGWKDLRQDFYVKIMTLNDDYFPKIRDLRFFAVRTIINLNSDHLRRLKTKPQQSNIEDLNLTSEDSDLSQLQILEVKDQIIKRLPHYERIMWQMYENGESMLKIHQQTKISRSEVARVINQVKELIKTICSNLPS